MRDPDCWCASGGPSTQEWEAPPVPMSTAPAAGPHHCLQVGTEVSSPQLLNTSASKHKVFAASSAKLFRMQRHSVTMSTLLAKTDFPAVSSLSECSHDLTAPLLYRNAPDGHLQVSVPEPGLRFAYGNAQGWCLSHREVQPSRSGQAALSRAHLRSPSCQPGQMPHWRPALPAARVHVPLQYCQGAHQPFPQRASSCR